MEVDPEDQAEDEVAGGATDIRIGNTSLYYRVIVAGGGGGSAGYNASYDASPGVGGGSSRNRKKFWI